MYTVRQLAEIAGVTVRTLHHYDRIGLLAPSSRTDAGYRLYGEQDLLRLQQILFFKELDFPLAEIRRILDSPDFDQVEALKDHRRVLEKRMDRLRRLQGVIDKTIQRLTEDTMTESKGMNARVTDAELYEGFSREEADAYRREAREKHGAGMVDVSERRVRAMSKGEWQRVKEEGGEIYTALARLMEQGPDAPETQAVIARHVTHIERFYPVSRELYQGLGQLYVEDGRFHAFYEKIRPGLAQFIRDAIDYHATHEMEG